MDKGIINSTLTKYFLPLNLKAMSEEVRVQGLDKYSKKLDCTIFTRLFIFAQVNQISSLRNLSAELNEDVELQSELGLESISASQLSRKLREVKPDFLQSVFRRSVDQVVHSYGVKKATQTLGRLNLIDSSTVTMCLSLYPWAKFRDSKAGVKLHTRLVYFDGEAYPDEIALTTAKPSDRSQMDTLVVCEPEALNVFDRGYVDYGKFDQYCHEGVRFVTRLRENAFISEVIEERPLQPGTPVTHDAVIKLGSSFRSMVHPVRRVEVVDNEGRNVIILTNDFDLTAAEICDVYRKRWQIELFFKWIKQHLRVKNFYGQSENAVYNQLWIALISFCLLVLLQRGSKYNGRLLDIHNHLRRHWAKDFSEFLKYLNRPPSRRTRGRARVNHERTFEETLQQFEDREAGHLDCPEYDPMF